MTGLDPSDEDLFRQARSGEEGAFLLLYRRWQGPLYRFALRMSGAAATAEDVVQEVFMALIHRTDGYDPGRGRLGPYLYGIARKHVLRRLERDRPYVGLSTFSGVVSAHERSSDDDPLLDLTRTERIEAVRAAVLALPAHYRETVVLCDLQGLAYEEAATVLGCAIGTVRSRLHRAREMLVARLGAREDAVALPTGPPRTAPGLS